MADPSDQSTYCHFCLEHLLDPNGLATGECPQIERGDALRLRAIREAIYPAYHNALKERYRTRRRMTGGRQNRESVGKRNANEYALFAKT